MHVATVGENNQHLTKLLATFECHQPNGGEPLFYFLYDFAKGDLEDVFASTQYSHQNSITWVAEQFHGLAEALQAVHNERKDDLRENLHATEDRFYGRHGDIKPSNILWFNSEATGGKDILALSDFGTGRLHTKPRTTEDPRNLAGTLTYRPPEFDLPGELVSLFPTSLT